MSKKRLTTLLFAALVFALPVFAVFNTSDLSQTLHNLRQQLGQEYQKISRRQARLASRAEETHQQMIDLIKECNELSLVLYSQRQEYTFDLTYALKKVTEQYNKYNHERRPYDQFVSRYDQEIDRYARLLEALRRLPPERKEISEVVPDSLRYRNDTLEMHMLLTGTSLNMELTEEALKDTTSAPFILDEKGEMDRDSCIFYASELLKMYAGRKEAIVSDSTHYQETQLRLKESYDYARERYKVLQKRIFVDGETKWVRILNKPARYWKLAVDDLKDKYDFTSLPSDEKVGATNRAEYQKLLRQTANRVVGFVILLFVFSLAVILLCRFVKPLRDAIAKEQKPFISLLLTILVFIIMSADENKTIQDEVLDLASTFLWLLGAILAALLIRLKPAQLKASIRLYLPSIILAFGVIGCRVLFLPNSMMNFLFPPVLIAFSVWQFAACIRCRKKVQDSDRNISWFSLLITVTAGVMSILGYTFMALLVLVWWYFQLAAIHTINTVWSLLERYRSTRMDRRIKNFKKEHSSGLAKDESSLLFGATWFYDLFRTVIIPVAAIASIPLCLKLALDMFDFSDLYDSIYRTPFIHIVAADGASSLRVSFHIVLVCIGLFFVFRYLAQALRAFYVYSRFAAFRRKYNRKTVRNNEINFSLGNSLITVLVWVLYIIVVFALLKIPTGWMAMIATGLSAGIGLAMKDILNNFIYGIQLMGGRLRVGDWIECDGVRGTVTKISYQSTQIETLDDALISFLNADLFSKNFANLTRNNSYEFVKIIVGVAYGTDVERVRKVLVDAMQVLRTKDAYGREIVRPDKGIYVVFGDFGDSSVDIAVKQYVLVAERIGYVDRAKEVIYKALNESGITIPFPQLDIHVSKEE